MLEVFTLLFSLASLASILIPIFYFAKSENAQVVVRRILSVGEIEEAKQYAAMFGLDNDMTNIDVVELIRIGRKYRDELGSETISNIATKHYEHHKVCNTMQSNIARYRNVRRHYVNQVVKEHGLVIAASHITVFTKILTGGNKNEEPSINAI